MLGDGCDVERGIRVDQGEVVLVGTTGKQKVNYDQKKSRQLSFQKRASLLVYEGGDWGSSY